MSEESPPVLASEFAFELHGVRVAVSVPDDELLGQVREVLPPDAVPCSPAAAEQRFSLVSEDDDGYRLVADPGASHPAGDRQLAVGFLDALLRMSIAVNAPGRIFVHAGVVGYRGRAIVLPAPTMSGKTTLVAELTRAGALYYSDEYAVLDHEGYVHPFARPLSIRGADLTASDHHVDNLGGTAGSEPLPIGLIAVTRYRPGAAFEPRQTSVGEGVLALLVNTVPAAERPNEALEVGRRAAERAMVLEGDRGEAPEAARALLATADELAVDD